MSISFFEELMFGDPEGDYGRVLRYKHNDIEYDEGTLKGAWVLCRVWDRKTFTIGDGETMTFEKGQNVTFSINKKLLTGEITGLKDGTMIDVKYTDDAGEEQWTGAHIFADNVTPA